MAESGKSLIFLHPFYTLGMDFCGGGMVLSENYAKIRLSCQLFPAGHPGEPSRRPTVIL